MEPLRHSAPVVDVSDVAVIERALRGDVALHLYELGDLDPFFFPLTQWFGLGDRAAPRALALLYHGLGDATLLVLATEARADAAAALLDGLWSRLPPRFYAHLSPGLLARVPPEFRSEPHGRHLKMALRDPSRLARVDATGVLPLGVAHEAELRDFYARAYPDNWFDPRMLETGQYRGIRVDGRLACVAGVHVYSARQRVAALGNVATAVEARGRGLARRAVAALCESLRATVDTIGLNVAADNAPALACYRALGFDVVAAYDEATVARRDGATP
jgi:ribosomal protein S18 acetylase RimI-like enzyme